MPGRVVFPSHRHLYQRWKQGCFTRAVWRSFRSKAALDALKKAEATANQDQGQGSHLVLYNYPSFSGAFAALFAHLYHSLLRLPFLVLPFSSVEPFRVDDLKLQGLQTCYLLDFIGPKGFAVELSQFIPRVIAFDHRKSTVARASQLQRVRVPENLTLHIDTDKSSSRAVYDYFSNKLSETMSPPEDFMSLLNREDKVRVRSVLRYIEDSDLRNWDLPDIKAFNMGLREESSKLNCVTNPYVFEQLLKIDSTDVIAKGNSYICSRQQAAKKLLGNAFRIQLGRGFYGECLV